MRRQRFVEVVDDLRANPLQKKASPLQPKGLAVKCACTSFDDPDGGDFVEEGSE